MPSDAVDRRTFGRRLAAASLAASPIALAAGPLAADEADRPKADENSSTPSELTLQLIRQLYPHDFDDAQLAEICRQIEEDQARSKILSQFALSNADEPAPTFAAWRAED